MEHYPSDPAFHECRTCVCAGLRRVSRALTQHYERAFRGSGLRATQFSLLAVLTQTGPVPLSILARHAGLERTTLTRNLKLLKSKGFTRIRFVNKDQRVHQVELTAAGKLAAGKGLLSWRKAQKGVPAILQKHKTSDLLAGSNP